MKRTSKKLLSFILAAVMVVTSCSVGFTAFAADNSSTSESYWKNTTKADDAYQSIESLIDQLVPTILGIQINGETIGSLLGMSEEQVKNATLKEVVASASPMLIGLLGGSVDEKQFLIDHVDDITNLNWSDKYYKYYSYLNGSDDDTLSFYSLYNILEDGSKSTDNQEYANYCKQQLEAMNLLLKVAASAEYAYDSKDNKKAVLERYQTVLDAYCRWDSTGKRYNDYIIRNVIADGATADDINNVKLIVETDGDGNITSIDGANKKSEASKCTEIGPYLNNDPLLKQGVAIANEAISKYGTEQDLISTPAEALLYYYSGFTGYITTNVTSEARGFSYETMLSYIQLAEEGNKPLTTKALGGEVQEITLENYQTVLNDRLADFSNGDAAAASKKSYYFPKMIYTCLYDLAGKDFVSYNSKRWDSYGSSSYDAINAALLVRNGSVDSIDEAYDLFDAEKFDDDDIKQLTEHAQTGHLDVLHDFINSSECTLTQYQKDYLNWIYSSDPSHNEFAGFNAYLAQGVEKAKAYRPLYFENLRDMIAVKTGEETSFTEGDTKGCDLFELFNMSVSGMFTRDEIVSGSTMSGISDYSGNERLFTVSCPSQDAIEITKYEEGIKPEITKPENQYSYEKFALSDEYMVFAVNSSLNALLGQYLDPDTQIGKMINGILADLLETSISLYDKDGNGVLNNIWLGLYNEPVATIFNLVPVLVALVDEVAVPMLFSANGDVKFEALNMLISDSTTLLGKYGFENKDPDGNVVNNISVGISSTSFDLNTLLPALLTLLDKDGGYDAAHEITSTYGEWAADKNLTIKNGYKDADGNVYDASVLRITGVYAADKFLCGLNFKELFEGIDTLDAELADGLAELVYDVVALAKDAVNDAYNTMNGADAEKYYRYVKSGNVSADQRISGKGLNNIALSLPIIFDSLGKEFAQKHNIDTDWTAVYDGKFETVTKEFTYDSQTTKVEQQINTNIKTLKDYATNKNPAGVLTSLIDIVIGNMVNGVIDLANDTLSTENDITDNVSLVTGLLQSLGGVGPQSILTDILNGLFDLTRKDDASFTLGENKTTGFVGFSTESALFLIANISYTDGDVNKGIVPLIQGLLVGGDNQTDTNSTSSLSISPTLANAINSGSRARIDSTLDKESVEMANEFIGELDDLLSSLLANTKLNGFKFDSTDGILAGILTAVSRYIGKDNTNELLKLLDSYLAIFEATPQSGEVNAKEVYTNKKLNEIVTGTYTLLENIVNYVFYDMEGALLGNKDPYKVITGAIMGIVSPDSVAIRMEDGFAAKKDLQYKKSWTEVGNVNYEVKTGDKKSFYKGLGQSISGIAAILSAILTFSYTDATKSDNLYSAVLYPVFDALTSHTGADAPLSPDEFNSEDASDKIIFGVISPVANVLSQMYDAPATFLLNLVSGLSELVDDNSIAGIAKSIENIVNNVFDGVFTLIGDSFNAPSLASYLEGLMSFYPIELPVHEKNAIYNLIANIVVDENGTTLEELLNLRAIDWSKLANAGTPGEILVLVYNYIHDTILQSDKVVSTLDGLVSGLASIVKSLGAKQFFGILKTVAATVTNPIEIYWTFKEYAGKVTSTFVYPKNITAGEAEKGVDALDQLVENLFPLLNQLGVTNISGLSSLVNDKLYTNEILTKIATALYGALEDLGKKNDTLGNVIENLAGTDAVADYFMDSSYGSTYSSAASTLRSVSSWKNVKSLNWGFKNGAGNAQQGFINGLAAMLRPLNGILTILLADGKALLDESIDIEETIKSIELDNISLPIGEDSEYGCVLYITIKDAKLTLIIDSNNSNEDSKLEINIADIIEGWKINAFGSNGYESAVIPLLEAFMCKGIKTYDEYITDYKKAKDNLIIDIVTPLLNLVTEVCNAPAKTLTAILPNVAYFLDSNGLAQVVNNLLAPITSKNGIIGQLANYDIDIDAIIKQLAGKSLGDIITDAIGINVNLTFNLSDLNSCNIQDIIMPLIAKILANNNINIKLPDISFSELAALGTITTVNSKAKNDEGKYETRQVVAENGKVLIAVLRYVADVLIKNSTEIGKLVSNIDAIKKNSTLKNIIDCVFSSIKSASKDDIVRAIFYLLAQTGTLGVAEDAFFDYSGFKTKENSFTFGNMDEDFCRKLAPMLDGLVGGLIDGGLNSLIGNMLYKDDIVSSIATGLYSAVEGVKVGNLGSLTSLLEKTGIDFTTSNVAALLTDKAYGQTYEAAAKTIKSAGSWKNVNKSSLSWGVTDRESFLNALVAVLRPLYGVLDVLLNNSRLNLFNLVAVQGSDGYTSFIVPVLEAFGCYNIKTQYDYRQDMAKSYDAILLDILNPIMDKVEDILNAPIETLADILPNLSLFFANNGLLQVLDNLLTPVSALLDALKPIVNVNALLKVLGVNVNSLLAKIGIKSNVTVNVYDLKATLLPLIGSENVVSLLNGILGSVKIGGSTLGIVLPEIDWLELATHGELQKVPSQVATIGERICVKADQDETLIALLRFIINTVNYQDNYDAIVNLVGGLLGGASDSISDVVGQVLGMLKGDADSVIESLVDLLQSLAG